MSIPKVPSTAINNLPEVRPAQNSQGSVINKAGKTFGQILTSLNESQQSSDNLLQQLAMGENVDLHNVMIGLEENDVNFRVALAIRDRFVDAYREVMRMQV